MSNIPILWDIYQPLYLVDEIPKVILKWRFTAFSRAMVSYIGFATFQPDADQTRNSKPEHLVLQQSLAPRRLPQGRPWTGLHHIVMGAKRDLKTLAPMDHEKNGQQSIWGPTCFTGLQEGTTT